MTSLTSSHHILDKHTIIYMFCSKWTSHRISHQCEISSEKSILKKQINTSIYIEHSAPNCHVI